jgi:small-conductance mechanosensitive channel
MDWVSLSGPERALHLFGVRLVGFDAVTLRKLLLTVAFLLAVMAVASLLRALARLLTRGDARRHARFLSQQLISIVTTLIFLIIFISIWLNDPARFASAAALVTAGLAVALQKLVMSVAGYVAILRGHTFRVGDRITMGDVRGDVIAVGYIRTTIMEMGQPPEVQSDDPAMWVEARQYTGRIVSVTNDKIFERPVYNFTREFPFLFEETHVPIHYGADHAAVEQILLDAATRHTVKVRELSEPQLQALRHRYFLRHDGSLEPRVYMRLTDNWVQLTVRYVVHESGIRVVKDAMSRQILAAMAEQGITVASQTVEINGLPEVRVRSERV